MFNLQKILERLPDNYVKNTASNLGNLFRIFNDKTNEILTVKDEIKKASEIDNATGLQLDRLGVNVQQPRGGRSDSKYRALIKTKISSNLSAGDIDSIIEYLASLLQLDRSEITLRQNIYQDYRVSQGFAIDSESLYFYDDNLYSENLYSDSTVDYMVPKSDRHGLGTSELFEPAYFGIKFDASQTDFTISEIIEITESLSAAGVAVYEFVDNTA